MEGYRGFVTKLWNAARFCEMNQMRPDAGIRSGGGAAAAVALAAGCANTAIVEATEALEAYRFDEYAAAGYRFVWNTFCDWFLEFAKPLLAEGADPADTAEIRARRRPRAGPDPAPAAPGDPVRDRGTVGSFRLWRGKSA